jgi:hypothetical protein
MLLTKALNILLEGFDLVPCFQAFAHDTKLEFLHKNEILIHVKKNISGDFLLFKDITVVGINTERTQVSGSLRLTPFPHLLLTGKVPLFIISLLSIDIRSPMIKMAAILAS